MYTLDNVDRTVIVSDDDGVTEILPRVRTRFNYDPVLSSRAVRVDTSVSPDKAKQSFKDECDINTIVGRFMKTGQVPASAKAPMYGDFNGVNDFQTAMNAVIAAEEAFMEFPSDVRKRFANDPQMMMEFVADPDNKDEAIKLGLIPKPKAPAPEPPPMKVHVVASDAPKGA